MLNSNISDISENIFVGDSEMARLMRSLDWSQTPLGSVSGWAQSLKTSIGILMSSRYPMFVWWGREYANLYNDAYRPMMGAKHPHFLGQSAKDCWAGIWDVVGPLADNVLATGQSTWSENLLLIMDRNGYPEEAYFTFSYSPVRDESGGLGGIFCAVIETTKQVIGERRLRTLRELSASTGEAKTVEEACHLAMATLSANTHDIPFALLYLVEPERDQARLVGTTTSIEPGTLVSPEQVDLTQASDCWNLARMNQTREANLVEDLTSRCGELPGGAWSEPCDAALVMPLAKSGQAQQLAGVLVVGISPRRALDDEYRGFFDLVASHVTTAIANAEAYEAERKRAEALAELDRAKTLFFSNISHEFRTPLTLMLNPLEDLLANPSGPNPCDRDQLEIAYRNSQRLLKLVNTLLDFSRIEAGRIEAVYEPTDLAMLTTDLAGVFRSAIERVGLSLQVDCSPLPELVYVDCQMWEKIVLNLLSNAFKFTFEGEIAVSLSWHEGEKTREGGNEINRDRSIRSSPHVILQVRDTGTGIPSEDLPHIFERFHRVKGARGRSYEGSGIGLSLVQELVRLHGGTIEVSSAIARGTCFTVSIPAGYAHLPNERISATRTLTSTGMGATHYVEEALHWLPDTSSEFSILSSQLEENSLTQNSKLKPQNFHILLADDNADMRAYLKRLLSQQYEVEAVADGIAALAAIRQQRPDLVLADVMMPELDGFGLLRELRTNPQTKKLPIILLSARAGEEARIEGLEAGADDYLTKPFSARELLARVEATLKLAQLRREATQWEHTLRQEAESAKQTIETILSSIRDGFYTLDRDWRYTYVNDRYCEMAGRQRQALLGQGIWEIFPDTVGTEFYNQLQQVATEQTLVQFEYLYETWDRWYEHRVYPSPDGITVFIAEVTDRKRAETEIQMLNQTLTHRIDELQALFDLLPVGVAIAEDSECRMIRSNPYLSRILRVPVDVNHSHSVPPHERPAYRVWKEGRELPVEELPMQYAAIHNTEVRDEVVDIVHPDGSVIKLLSYASPLHDDRGKVRGAIGGFADITDLISTEAALRESEEQLRLATESANLGMWYWDGATDALTWTDRARVMFGIPADTEMTMRVFLETIHPDDLPFIQAVMRDLEMGHVHTEIEYRIRWADGTVRWISARGDCSYNADGTLASTRGVLIDITDRKQIEAALRQSEERYRYLVEATPQLVWAADARGRNTYVSQQMCDYIGLPSNQLLELNWQTIIHPEDGERVSRRWMESVQNGIPYEAEYRLCRSDGAYRWQLARAMPFRDEQGQIVQWFGVSTDIHEKQELEQQRSHLLQQAQAAREEAERANRIKDEFLAVLSHELRSPLNPILGWSKLLQSRKFDETRTKQALATIERNARLQSALIEDLLDVSRILRGKLSLTVSPINLASTIQAAIETMRLAAQAKSIQIQIRLNPEVGLVSGDSTRLQQVVWNLLSNAVKFTPEQGRVEVQLEQVDNQAQIAVTDTGKGIHPDFLPYVFDYFRQEDGATTRKFGGLGLGLAIVRHLVELHGGTVQADSPGEGLGATFTVRLPLMPTQPIVHQNTQSSDSSFDLKGIQVLAVDDETDTRDFVTFVLEQAGASVIAVSCASEAIAALTQSHCDVLLSDIGMPEMDGYMLMQQIKALPPEQGGQIKAIALTAYAGDFNQQQALQAGFQRHLAKPIEPEQLVNAIVQVVAQGLDLSENE